MLLGDTELVTLAGENAKTKSQEEEKHIFSIKNSSPSDHPGVTDQIWQYLPTIETANKNWKGLIGLVVIGCGSGIGFYYGIYRCYFKKTRRRMYFGYFQFYLFLDLVCSFITATKSLLGCEPDRCSTYRYGPPRGIGWLLLHLAVGLSTSHILSGS